MEDIRDPVSYIKVELVSLSLYIAATPEWHEVQWNIEFLWKFHISIKLCVSNFVPRIAKVAEKGESSVEIFVK